MTEIPGNLAALYTPPPENTPPPAAPPAPSPPGNDALTFFQTILAMPPCPADAHLQVYAAGGAGAPRAPGKALIPCADAPAWVQAMVATANGAGQHFWWRCAGRNAEGRILGTLVLWCDIDHGDTGKIATFSLKPTWTFWSGRGRHLVWMLSAWCDDLDLIQAKLLGICTALGGDTQAAQIHAGLRVPGNINTKHLATGTPALYTCHLIAEESTGQLYDITDFPGTIAKGKKRRAGGPGWGTFREMFLRYFPDGDPGKDEWIVTCPFHDDSKPSLCINVAEGIYVCKADSCGVRGNAVKFYAAIEGISLDEARKAIPALATQASAVACIQRELGAMITPLYRDRDRVTFASKASGQHMTFSGASRSSVQGALQSLLDGSPAQYVIDTLGESTSLRAANEIVVEAALGAGSGVPDVSKIKLLGQGIHWTEHGLMRVDGWRLWARKGGGWALVHDHVHEGRYVAWARSPDSWYPNEALPRKLPSAAEVFQTLLGILTPSWVFFDPMDYQLITAYTLYASIWHLFETPLHLHVSARSQTGKTSLTKGWFAGMLPGSAAMVPGCRYMTNATAASIYQRFNRGRLPLVLDEVLDYQNLRARDVVELIRTMEHPDAEVWRGSQDGRERVYSTCFPTVWSSIHVPDQTQDANRRLHLEIPHLDPAPPNPWTVIAGMGWEPAGLRALAATAFEVMLGGAEELRRLHQEAKDELRGRAPEGGNYRSAIGCAPLIAVARFCGVDPNPLLERILGKARDTESEASAGDPVEQLRERILLHRLKLPGGLGEITLRGELVQGSHRDVDLLGDGIFVWGKERLVGVIAGAFARAERLDMSVINFGRLVKHIHGFKESKPISVNGGVHRFSVFSIPELLQGVGGNGKTLGPVVALEQPLGATT